MEEKMILNEQREILFRGKKVNMNDWVYGYPCAPIQIVGREPAYAISTTAKLTRDMGGIFVSPFNGNMCREAYEVYPKTIGQYTGFKDCNGKKIFEHDIVAIYSIGEDVIRENPICEFHKIIDSIWYAKRRFCGYEQIAFLDGAWFSFKQTKDSRSQTSLSWQIKNKYCEIEVVGNVFDDFELLEEQK